MNLTHVHLLINHVAVIGAFLGMIVLLYALRFNSKETYYAAYSIFAIAALGAIIAFSTGESAEETVEGIAGISNSTIESHEDAAKVALGSFIVLGILASIGIFVSLMRENLQRKWGLFILVVSLFSFVIISQTAWLGGKIRHSEIAGSVTQNQDSVSEEEDD